MDNKKLIDLYKLDKLGLHNTLKKKCICGNEMNIEEKKCANCGIDLPKTKLLNVNKNTAIAKRVETSLNGNVYSYQTFQLLSNGFELYESETLNFSINKSNCEVKISNTKIFKAMETNQDFMESLEDNFPGFYSYVVAGLGQMRHQYAITKFTSLTESLLSNFLNVYLNYRALSSHLMGYKVYYYGNKVNLKKYYPNVDFNDIKSVNDSGLCIELLPMWDIKNEKYVETIIDISNSSTKDCLNTLRDIITTMLRAVNNKYFLEYNDFIDTFSLLFNKEITLTDFIRIYNNSPEDYFAQLYKFRQLYKKIVNNVIDWSTIDKIDRRLLGTLTTKQELMKEMKLSKQTIEKIYETLEKSPFDALNML